jgi:hypothetical protein
MSEYTAKRAHTRGVLLAAGQELLPGAVRRGLEHALGPGAVTVRADVSRQTWYRYWRADDSEYLDDLLRAALDTIAILLGPRLQALAASEYGSAQGAYELAHAHFLLAAQRRVAIPHLVGVVLALEDRHLEAEDGIRPTSAPEIVREYHRRVHEALVDAYGVLLDRWGRVPNSDNDLARIVTIIGALSDGFALRQVVAPDGVAEDEFATLAVGVLEALTAPRE